MRKLTRDEFIEQAIAAHGHKYDYSRVVYNGSRQKVVIICPKHGEFLQLPNAHAQGQGCPKCYNEARFANRLLTMDEFLQKAHQTHGDKYDYSKVVYTHSQNKVTIICPVHGEFKQAPADHLRGQGCPRCYADATRLRKSDTQADFIRKAKQTHGDVFDYSLVKYTGCYNKVEIICPNGHRFWQMPSNHIFGQGCPVCMESEGEQAIRTALTNEDIKFFSQKRFPEWLGLLSLDFYLPELNIGIEHQGLQHVTPVKQWGNFNSIHERDLHKQKVCSEHGIKILYIAKPIIFNYPRENWEWMQPHLFTDIAKLMEYINSKCTK